MASKLDKAGQSQNYQRFAWVTLALAVLVALFSADGQAPASTVTLAESAPAAAVPVRHSPSELPPAALDEPGSSDETTGEEVGEQPVTPPGPGSDPLIADAKGKASGAAPFSPEQAGRLLASSRNRSGGVDQGDEPVRASLQ